MNFKPIAHVVTPKRHAQVQEKFDKYDSWVLFVTRFPPDLHIVISVTIGISHKVSYPRSILMDGLTVLISVPMWAYLGSYSAENIDRLMVKVHSL